MTFRIVADVLDANIAAGAQAKLVLIALAERAHADGSDAYPSVKTLARYAQCSERTVQRVLRALVADGVVVVQEAHDRGHHRPTTYAIDLQRLAALRSGRQTVTPPATPDPAPSDADLSSDDGRQTDTPDPERGDTVSPGGVTSTTERGDIHDIAGRQTDTRTKEPNQEQNRQTGDRVRDRDEVFDDLAELFGEPANDTERGRRNKAVADLRAAGWNEGELRRLRDRATAAGGWIAALVATDVAMAANISNLRRLVDGTDDRDRMAAVRERLGVTT